MSSTHSNSSGTLNPEAHEFKFKLFENSSRSNEESSQNNSENGKKSKGKYNLISTN